MAPRYESQWVRALLAWFAANRREMPWRSRPDPYHVWVSEIMLQQTQVAAVTPYFNRFIRRFPDIAALARSEAHDVLLVWEGLGYYSRARNLLRAARLMNAHHRGNVPRDFDMLRSLPGIGDYTAAAIASICFGVREPSVDGNVVRVFTRLRGVDEPVGGLSARRRIADRLRPFMPPDAAGDFNQALMELGALVCRPIRPVCGNCPLAPFCRARRQGCPEAFPARGKRRDAPLRRKIVALIQSPAGVLLEHRSERGMLAGLWTLPIFERRSRRDRGARGLAGQVADRTGLSVAVRPSSGRMRHAYTHFRVELDIRPCRCLDPELPASVAGRFRWLPPAKAGELPIDRASRKILAELHKPCKP